MNLKKIASYLWPFTLKKYHSSLSGDVNINLINGNKTLDTSNSNYSFGSLQKILKTGLKSIDFDERIKSILVLGLGAGSIVQTIREDFHSEAFIELVEIDKVMIDIAEQEFNLNQFKNIKVVHLDANEYVRKTDKFYDLIIIDLFIGNTIPDVFTQYPFISQVIRLLNSDGKIIFNTMRETMPIELLNSIELSFEAENMQVNILEKVEWSNDLLIIESAKIKQAGN